MSVLQLFHSVPILEREAASVSGEKPNFWILSERPASRAVAKELAVSHPTIIRAVRAAEALSKYPALERLNRVSDVQMVDRVMDNR